MANASKSSYQLENIAFPDDKPPEIGGLALDKNGNLSVDKSTYRTSENVKIRVTESYTNPATSTFTNNFIVNVNCPAI